MVSFSLLLAGLVAVGTPVVDTAVASAY